MPIHFFSEETSFQFDSTSYHQSWIELVLKELGFAVGEINYVFCSDEYLLEINRKELNHDYYTDIITFDTSFEKEVISADLFISVDRVRDNAVSESVHFRDELDRVLIHGLLHLCGYSDNDEKEKAEIRKKEDDCLSLRSI